MSSSASKLASLWGLWLDHWTWRRFTRIPKKCRGQSKELPLVKKKKGKTQETGKEKHIAKTQNSSRTRKRRRRRRRRRRSARKGRSKFKSKASSSSGRSNHTHVSHTHTLTHIEREDIDTDRPLPPDQKKRKRKKNTHTHTHLQAHTHSYTHTGVGVWVCVARQSQVHAPRLLRFAIPKNSVLFSRPVASPFLNARTSANRYSLTHSLSLFLSLSLARLDHRFFYFSWSARFASGVSLYRFSVFTVGRKGRRMQPSVARERARRTNTHTHGKRRRSRKWNQKKNTQKWATVAEEMKKWCDPSVKTRQTTQ